MEDYKITYGYHCEKCGEFVKSGLFNALEHDKVCKGNTIYTIKILEQ